MVGVIGRTIEPTEIKSDNVVSLNPPKMNYRGMEMVHASKISFGFSPKSMMMTETDERLGIKSVEDVFGWEFSRLRKLTAELPFEHRWVNPNPVSWSRPSATPSFQLVHAWWLDLMYVLAQTVPEIAKTYFMRLDEFYDDDPEGLRKTRREFRKRLKKVNLRKLRNLSSKSPKDMTETEMRKIWRLQNEMAERTFWEVIGKCIGTQYVTNYVMNPNAVEHLMCSHTVSEMSIPLFARSILGEEWRKSSSRDEKDPILKVGDACTVFGAMLFNSFEDGMTRDDIEEIVNTKSMRSYFDLNVREFLVEHLASCFVREGGLSIPFLTVDDI
jgi:hypothetical protein